MIFVDNVTHVWVEVPDALPQVFPVISTPVFNYFEVMPMSLAHETTFRREHPIYGKVSASFKPEYTLLSEQRRTIEFMENPQRWYGLRNKEWAEFTSFATLGEPPANFIELIKTTWKGVPKRRFNYSQPSWGMPWFRDQFGREVFGYSGPLDWSKYSEKLRIEQTTFYEQNKLLYNVSNSWIDANDNVFESFFPKERK